MNETRASSTSIGTSYIVRIYRRTLADDTEQRSGDAVELIGTVEEAQDGKRSGFHNVEELWAVLSGASQTDRPDQRGKGG
jgi:hypothetical protein